MRNTALVAFRKALTVGRSERERCRRVSEERAQEVSLSPWERARVRGEPPPESG
jgi:hypothetical protein